MAVQTTYGTTASAYPGLIADNGLVDILSYAAEASDIEPGLGVIEGTDPEKQALLATATGGVILGITVRRLFGTADASDQITYKENKMMDVIASGRVWVLMEDAHTRGDDVYVRHTAGGGGAILGSIRTDADTATADQIVGATVLTSAGAGALAQIQLPFA